MNYVIKKADVEDAQGIAKVHVETWQSHYKGQIPDDHLANLSVEKRTKFWTETFSNPKPNNMTFVANESGEVLGFCSVGPSRDSDATEGCGELYAIYLSSKNQAQGIGSALMNEGLKFLKEQGFKIATLWVLKSNTSTIKFYESKGWKIDGKEKSEEKDNFTFKEIRYQISL